MSTEEEKLNPLFLHLVLSLQSAAWYQMGKTVSPISGKIERDMQQAKASIDMLVMLQEKTDGNLSDEEKNILDNAVYSLQMNYIEELEKDKKEKEPAKTPDEADNKAGPTSGGKTEDLKGGSGKAEESADAGPEEPKSDSG